ncbi:hypothetical protein FPZ12_008140 [Amycolatopsis acidicola]|uniref:Esterase n=1 Tax=Amycolatopsis acidicola TaxID=2596893 RepID=A0A5N0VC68_9PSEU|nr:alpha/beta hydrolase-fold protein [Amycolatopsis acidicola]KAA9163987.1 hypothetical protein FPZ12_008140 [Amycolatopsis acidicola]
MRFRKPGRARLGLAMFAVVSAVLGVTASAAAAANPGGVSLAPEVVHTGTAPTGYQVTFRFKDPNATRVQLKGEWYFADPRTEAQSSTTTNTIVTPGLLPSQWKPGDFPIQSPNNNGANWPVIDMTKGRDGIWSYTTVLPSGVFNYQFYVDCAGTTQSGCTAGSDPSNPPWNQVGDRTIGSTGKQSQVSVPSDPRFGTIDYSWEAAQPVAHGTLADVSYRSPVSLSPDGMNNLAVYTPPGYDSRRAQSYPTLYLAHGAGDNELAWSTSGDAANILDNLIATGQIQPMVVVMPDGTQLPGTNTDGTYNQEPYDQNLISTVVPYIESHYHVSTSPSDRAMAGLSQGSGIANSLLFNHTDEFAYYGSFSRGPSFAVPTASALTAQQVAAIQRVRGVFVGSGWEEFLHPYSPQMINTLTSIGAAVTPDFTHGGHEWYLWRILLRDFLTHVAFFPSVNDGS